MKKVKALVMALMFLGLLVSPTAAGSFKIYKIWQSATISGSGTLTSNAIDLNTVANEGYFSIQYALSGASAPTLKFEYLQSNDGVNFLEPSTASDIASSIVKTSGPNSDGKDIVSFTPPPARWMKIKATESNGDDGTLSLYLFVQ